MPTDKVLVTRDNLDLLANAIASKASVSVPMTISQMTSAVEGIQGGGTYQSKTVTPTYSVQTILPDTGYDALSQVTVNAMPPSSEDSIIDRTISGTYVNSTVTEIGSYAFTGATSLRSVSFPLVSEIGNAAFYNCTSLTNVDMPSLKSTYGSSNFMFTNIVNVSFPVLENVASDCFYGGVVQSVSLSACETLGSRAFYNCTHLTTVSLPVCSDIGMSAFGTCYSLSNFYAPSAQQLGAHAFSSCWLLPYADFPLARIVGSSCFYNCTSLSYANLSAADQIGDNAFYGCSRLTSVNLQGSIIYFGAKAFTYCYSLSEVSMPYAQGLGRRVSVTELGYYFSANSQIFMSCSALTKVYAPRVSGPIGSSVFAGCTNLSEVYMPYVWGLYPGAFSSCRSLKSVQFHMDPFGGVGIRANAFYGCSNLSFATFAWNSPIFSSAQSGSTISVYGNAFGATCSSLKKILFTRGRFYFSANAFSGLSLDGIYMLDSSVLCSTQGAITMQNFGNLTNLSFYVRDTTYNSYITSTIWSTQSSRFVSLTQQEYYDILNEYDPPIVIPD